jgi:hypothetical protein
MNIEDLIFTILISILTVFFIINIFNKEVGLFNTISRIDLKMNAMNFADNLMINLSDEYNIIEKGKIANLNESEINEIGILFLDIERNISWEYGNIENHTLKFSLPFLLLDDNKTYAAKVIFFVK